MILFLERKENRAREGNNHVRKRTKEIIALQQGRELAPNGVNRENKGGKKLQNGEFCS